MNSGSRQGLAAVYSLDQPAGQGASDNLEIEGFGEIDVGDVAGLPLD